MAGSATTSPPAPQGAPVGLGADGTSSPTCSWSRSSPSPSWPAIAVWAAFPLIAASNWWGLAVVAGVTALAFYVYLSPRAVPLKYLLPGTLFLIVFQILPVLYTVSTAFTNFGDGHRGNKEQAITAIQGASVKQVPDSTIYTLTLATDGDPADRATSSSCSPTRPPGELRRHRRGAGGARRGDFQRRAGRQDHRGRRLHGAQHPAGIARQADITAFSVPDRRRRDQGQGLSTAFEGAPQQSYDEGCDCITDTTTGQRWTADDENGTFVDEDGERPRPGLEGQRRPRELRPRPDQRHHPRLVLRIVVWNFAFAIVTVAITFALGLLVALALNNPLMQGQHALPVADHPPVRDAGGRDVPGLAGDVQHRLRPDQPDARDRHQLVRQHRRARCSRSCWCSCGSATTTCSWSSPAPCSRSPPT